MIKRILVPTDSSKHATVGARYAIELAAQHGASLHGLYVVDIRLLEGPFFRDLSASLGTAPFVNYQANIAMLLEERGKSALAAFETLCGENGVEAETTIDTGTVTRCIAERSALMDLLVMGRGGEHTEWLDGLLGSTTEVVVRRAHCPVLITQRDFAKIGRFVAAYDGSNHAKSALHIAAGLGETWRVPCDVLAVGGAGREAWLEEAQSYLDAHGVQAAYLMRDGDPGEQIVSYAAETQADLVVMGAYGHTKVRELVVGSTTAYVVNHIDCPVLLTR